MLGFYYEKLVLSNFYKFYDLGMGMALGILFYLFYTSPSDDD